MKKIICAILLLTLVTTLFSCKNDPETPEGMQLVSTDNVAYRFYVPKTWTINMTDNTMPNAYFSAADKSNVSVMSEAVNEINTLEGYWEYCDEKYRSQLINYEQVGEKETLLVDGGNAAKYVYRFNLDGVNYKTMQTITGKDGYIYSISYVSVIENYDLHVDTVNTIIAAFKFR